MSGRRPIASSLARSSAARSRASGGLQAELPHQLYMRMTCLEMERHRRGVERDAAMKRVNACDARSKEIDAEILLIKSELERRRGGDEPANEAAREVESETDVEVKTSRRRMGRALPPIETDPIDPGPISFKY